MLHVWQSNLFWAAIVSADENVTRPDKTRTNYHLRQNKSNVSLKTTGNKNVQYMTNHCMRMECKAKSDQSCKGSWRSFWENGAEDFFIDSYSIPSCRFKAVVGFCWSFLLVGWLLGFFPLWFLFWGLFVFCVLGFFLLFFCHLGYISTLGNNCMWQTEPLLNKNAGTPPTTVHGYISVWV